MSSLDAKPARRWWLAAACVLLIAACQRDPQVVDGAATEPVAAMHKLARHLEQGDLVGFAHAAVPPAQREQLARAWADGDSLWPLTGLPLDEHLPDLLAALAAPDAASELRRAHRTQFVGQGTTLRQTAQALGLFGSQYVQHQGQYSSEQREHYRQLVLALSQWAALAGLDDPQRAGPAIDQLTAAVGASGLDGRRALAGAGMEPALERLTPVQQALFEVLAGYGLDLRQSLGGLQARLLSEDGDEALLQVQYPLAGQQIQFKARMRRVDGRWYMAQNLADAAQALASAGQARQARLEQPPAPADGGAGGGAHAVPAAGP